MVRSGAIRFGAVLVIGVLVGWVCAQLTDRTQPQSGEVVWEVDSAPGPLGPWRYALLSLRDAVELCGAKLVHPDRIDWLEDRCGDPISPSGRHPKVQFGLALYRILRSSGSMELGADAGGVPVRIELPTDPGLTLDFEIRRDDPYSVAQVGCRVGDAELRGGCPVDLLDGWDTELVWTPLSIEHFEVPGYMMPGRPGP